MWISFNHIQCATGTHNCDTNASCTDTLESFQCSCNAGYEGDGVICTDTDECTANTDNCTENEFCVNNQGGFSCFSCSYNCMKSRLICGGFLSGKVLSLIFFLVN